MCGGGGAFTPRPLYYTIFPFQTGEMFPGHRQTVQTYSDAAERLIRPLTLFAYRNFYAKHNENENMKTCTDELQWLEHH